eukprot:10829306-Alexandrium_andersonii.AAC.1
MRTPRARTRHQRDEAPQGHREEPKLHPPSIGEARKPSQSARVLVASKIEKKHKTTLVPAPLRPRSYRFPRRHVLYAEQMSSSASSKMRDLRMCAAGALTKGEQRVIDVKDRFKR